MAFTDNSRLKIASILFLFAAIIACATIYYIYEYNNNSEEVPFTISEPVIIKEYGLAVDSFNIIKGRIKTGESFSAILNSLHVSSTIIEKLVNSSDDIFDLRKIKAGKQYTAFCSKDSSKKLQYFVYEHSAAEYIFFNLNDSINVSKEQKEVLTREVTASATITSSLWKAMEENDINIEVAVRLSEMFAWTIDFFDLKKNDYFKVVYEEQFVDSTSIGVKKIIGACFNHKGKNYYAIPFYQDGVTQFFDEKGNSQKKAFLKAPLKFSRITSKFTNARFHPVLKIYTSHFGVDYAAPIGTPVHAIGNGKIIMASFDMGAGNIIKIKHSGGYITSYMHLSRFGGGIKNGTNVSQGDIIGYVGSTGLSTGPHLDFRVFKNGTPLDPLKMISPPTEPLNKKYKSAFDALKNKLIKQFEKIKI